ncbi:TraI domain-containing protein [bacterium]|nr:TraI domain-containing protein [bacterium]
MPPTHVMVRSFEIRKTRRGDNYASLRMNLGDAGGFADIDARIWDFDRVCAGRDVPTPGDVLQVDYREEDYNGRPQWIVQDWRRLDGPDREASLEHFVPTGRVDLADYARRLEALIDQTNPARAAGMLVRMIYDRAGFREAFYKSPAARDHHQAYPGGLLEHTVNVATVALAMADAYAQSGAPGLSFNSDPIHIDRQVLIAAALLHDVGKVETYCFSPLPEITEAQRWEGHLVISYAWVREAATPLLAEMPGSADEINMLLHCILAHHGQLEFGSPTVPACAEAFLLSQADMTDARLAEIAETGAEALARDPQTRWLPRNNHFPGGVFIGGWNEKE